MFTNKSRYALGLDIVEISKFKKLIHDNSKSWQNYFSIQELDYCQKLSQPEIHLAARFAAKEAVIKAMSQFGIRLKFNQIEIIKDSSQAPYVNLKQIKPKFTFSLSLSHTKDLAAAVIIVERRLNH